MSCCEGFRLNGSPSEWSMRSKARIDALFEDSRSVCSSTFGGWYPSNLVNAMPIDEPETDDQQRKVNSAVQARIEAMFASVEAETGTPGECAAAILPVKYMGAAPVGGRVASVRGLQEPLRQLLERIDESVVAELEVSRRGLTFRTAESSEKTNPFRRIAVWSALRLRRKTISSGEVHHAFMPLVGDDYGTGSDEKHAELYRTMRSITKDADHYPPIFAVVMRRPGATRLLECHAFACQNEEDAVAAAATLYRALLADLDTNRRRPRHTNGVGCVSLASVASSEYVRDSVIELTTLPSKSYNGCCSSSPQSNSVTNHPVRPPRSKKSLTSSATEEDSPNYVEKVPRRKKKMSEIRQEDVLEARSRKMSSSSQGEQPVDLVEARLKKNKMSSSKPEVNILNDENIHHAVMTNDECVIYGRLEDRKEDGSSSSSQQNYKLKQDNIQIHTPVRSSDSQSLENSLYEKSNQITKNHENHFRNVDKIYSLSQEDSIYNSRGRSVTRNMQQKVSQEVATGNKRNSRKVSRDMESLYSNNRISCSSDNIKRRDDMSENRQSRVRRRSRAGSEPPVSRTEDASAMMQDQKLKRSQSDYDVDKGDLMTRVELPRRGSFLNQGTKRRTISMNDGTPLGFTELFDEFRNQEGLTSIDDILAAIIDPEGMSFNDLKPLYKEFLLKLASTLTQDELYQRSASIMRRRRRPQRRRSTRRPCLLGRAIKRSVSRLKSGPTEFTSVIFSPRRLNESFDRSSSSCDVRNNHRNRVLSSRLDRRRPSHRRIKHVIGHTTSEDSDTCRRLARSAAANRSSSGYVSCSECSYDSESCTCVSADKCYCSLSRRVPVPVAPGPTIVCACDTDSCSESNKCYCPRKPTVHPSIMEQLRQSGIMPHEHSMSRSGTNKNKSKTQRNNRRTPNSRTEYVKERSSSARGSTDNLALDYDLFRPEKKAQQSSIADKILVVSARDPQGRLVYVGGDDRHKRSSKNCTGRGSGHHEALSIKKSAEIAAVFGSRSSRPCRRANSGSSLHSSASLEAGLGYLP